MLFSLLAQASTTLAEEFHQFIPHVNDAGNPFIWLALIGVPICLGIGGILLVFQIFLAMFRK